MEQFEEGAVKKSYAFFRPSLNLSHPLSKKWSLNYALRINPLKPTLSELTDVAQRVNRYEVYVGNPNLNPYQAYMNQLTLGYYGKSTSMSFSGYVQHNPKTVSANPAVYSAEYGGVFVFTNGIQKSFTHVQLRAYASQKLFEEKLTISGMLAMNRYINLGNDYTTTLTAYLLSLTASYDARNWGLTVDYMSPIKPRFAQTTIENSQNLQAQAYYRTGNFRIGVGVQNPFMGGLRSNERYLDSELVESNTVSYVRSNNNVVYVTLSWSFSKGLKWSYRKQLNNSDATTGIVK